MFITNTMLRLIIVSCLIFSVVYCQTSCSVNGCTYATATDRRKSASIEITFGSNLKYSPACVIIDKGTVVNFNGSFVTHPLEAGTYSSNGTEQPDPNSPIPSTSNGTTLAVTFNTEGVYPYYCDAHDAAGMIAAIYVGSQCGAKSSEAGVAVIPLATATIAGFVALF